MRSGASQQSPDFPAKVTIVVSGDTYTESDRIVRVFTDEQVWGGQYIVELDNADEALNAKDYKGLPIDFNSAFIGAAGSSLAPLWVNDQVFISKEGKLLLQLNCIDAWGLLARVTPNFASSAWNQEWEKEENLENKLLPSGEVISDALIAAISAKYGVTAYGIISSLISDAIGKTVVLDDDDGIINTEKPPLSVGNVISGIRQALDVTKSYLLWKPDGQFHVIQPDLHSTVYSYNVSNLFFSNIEDAAVTLPNRIYFSSYNLAGTEWISGSAQDDASHAAIGLWVDRQYLLANIGLDVRADETTLNNLASGVLSKIQGEKSQGVLVAPMHCSQELFDKISITDDRYTVPRVTTGYVHRITREYDRGVYRVTMQIGGVTSGYTSPGSNPAISLENSNTNKPTPYWRIPAAVQGYHHDLHFTASDWNTVAWTGGGDIKFYDGTTQSIVTGSYNLPNDLVTYLYFDLDDASPTVLKNTTDYLSVMSTKTGVLCMVQRGSDSTVKATVIPSFGKEPLITADIIYLTGLLDKLPNGTYSKILSTYLQAGRIKLTETSGDLDDIDDGSTHAKVKSTDISSGHIKLTTYTGASGKWYDQSEVEIEAGVGITILGEGKLALKTSGGQGEGYLEGLSGYMRIRGLTALKLGVTAHDKLEVDFNGVKALDTLNMNSSNIINITGLTANGNIDFYGGNYIKMPVRATYPSGPINGEFFLLSTDGKPRVRAAGVWEYMYS